MVGQFITTFSTKEFCDIVYVLHLILNREIQFSISAEGHGNAKIFLKKGKKGRKAQMKSKGKILTCCLASGDNNYRHSQQGKREKV